MELAAAEADFTGCSTSCTQHFRRPKPESIIWLRMNPSSPLVQIRPRSHQRYLQLPIFGRCIEDFVRWSLGKGYKHQTLRLQLEALQRLVPRFLRRGIRSPRDLTDDDVQAVRRQFNARRPHVAEGACAFGRFLKERHGLRPGRPQKLCRSDRIIPARG